MHRKDYIAIAKAFSDQYIECFGLPDGRTCHENHSIEFALGVQHARRILVNKLCAVMRDDNTYFDAARFAKACLPELWPDITVE